MSPLPKTLGVIATVAAATFLSGFAALAGARGGGLQESGWNWQFLPPLFYGWLGGFFVSLICLGVSASLTSSYGRRLAVTFLAPFLIAAVVSRTAYYIMLAPERRAEHNYRQVLSDLKARPEALHALVAQARARPLSSPERDALWQMLWVPQAISTDEISFLLDCFEHDDSEVQPISGPLLFSCIE